MLNHQTGINLNFNEQWKSTVLILNTETTQFTYVYWKGKCTNTNPSTNLITRALN